MRVSAVEIKSANFLIGLSLSQESRTLFINSEKLSIYFFIYNKLSQRAERVSRQVLRKLEHSYSSTSQEPPFVGPMCLNLPSLTRASNRRWTLLLVILSKSLSASIVINGFSLMAPKIMVRSSDLVRFCIGFVSVCIGSVSVLVRRWLGCLSPLTDMKISR